MAATYRAASAAATAVQSNTNAFSALYGSSTKTIQVVRCVVTATQGTAAKYGDITVSYRTSAISGGTKTDLTQVRCDSGGQGSPSFASGSASVCGVYTAAPTSGSGGGAIAARLVFMPITGTAAVDVIPCVFDFGAPVQGERSEVELPTLRGTAQGLEVAFGTAPGNAGSVMVEWVWLEI